MKTLFIVKAHSSWLDQDGKPDGYFDVHDYIDMCRKSLREVASVPTTSTALFR